MTLKLTGEGGFSAQGRFLMEKPERVLYTVKGGGLDYSFSSTEVGVIEIERSLRRYDEFPTQHKMIAPRSRISAAAEVGFPSAFVFADVRSIWPEDAVIAFKGTESLRGAKVDHVQATYAIERGTGSSDAYIDETGRLIQLVLNTNIQGLTTSFKHEYFDFATAPLGLPAFATPIPLGFVPHTIASAPHYLDDGEPIHKTRLTDSSGRTFDLKFGGKGTLLILTGPDCAPSARAEALLKNLRKRATSLGWGIEEISTATTAKGTKSWSGASRVLFDPAGEAWEMLGAQGTPSLLLVDSQGRRIRYWYGFDAAGAKALETDIVEALEGKIPEED